MAREEIILDFSQPAVKKMVVEHVRTLKGLYWFECRRCRDQRTLKQNAWYWVSVVKTVRERIAELWGEQYSSEQIHVWMRSMFLKQPIVNHGTGEVMGETVKSTTELDTKEFSDYVDRIIKWAGEVLEVEIPAPA